MNTVKTGATKINNLSARLQQNELKLHLLLFLVWLVLITLILF
jgi:hypothetical protein